MGHFAFITEHIRLLTWPLVQREVPDSEYTTSKVLVLRVNRHLWLTYSTISSRLSFSFLLAWELMEAEELSPSLLF